MATNGSLSLAYEDQPLKSSPTTTMPALGDTLPISMGGIDGVDQVVPS